jgi:hypothetical protein
VDISSRETVVSDAVLREANRSSPITRRGDACDRFEIAR